MAVRYTLRATPRKLSAKRKREVARAALEHLAAVCPDPRCELYYETPYQLLVSVVLSAQTTDKMVNRCMEPLYRKGFDPQTVLTWGAAGLLPWIRSIGFAPTKARNIERLTAILLEKHEGQVPHDRATLEALPGVGRKTANVILAEIFGEPTLAVDTHVFRVGYRLGLHEASTPDKAEAALLAVVPSEFLPKAHHWFILHGRYTCKAQRPLCETCPVRQECAVVEELDDEEAIKLSAALKKTAAKKAVAKKAIAKKSLVGKARAKILLKKTAAKKTKTAKILKKTRRGSAAGEGGHPGA